MLSAKFRIRSLAIGALALAILENAGPDIVNSPFLPFPGWMSRPAGEQQQPQE